MNLISFKKGIPTFSNDIFDMFFIHSINGSFILVQYANSSSASRHEMIKRKLLSLGAADVRQESAVETVIKSTQTKLEKQRYIFFTDFFIPLHTQITVPTVWMVCWKNM